MGEREQPDACTNAPPSKMLLPLLFLILLLLSTRTGNHRRYRRVVVVVIIVTEVVVVRLLHQFIITKCNYRSSLFLCANTDILDNYTCARILTRYTLQATMTVYRTKKTLTLSLCSQGNPIDGNNTRNAFALPFDRGARVTGRVPVECVTAVQPTPTLLLQNAADDIFKVLIGGGRGAKGGFHNSLCQ